MFKTKINKGIFAVFAILLVVNIIAVIFGLRGSIERRNPRHSLGLVLLCLILSTRTIAFTNEHIVVRYLYIPVRHISVSRISSIEFVIQKGEPYLVICLDGHQSIAESHKKLGLFMVSPKMIVIQIPDKERKEYVEKITQLYSDVSFVNWESTTH